MLSFSCDQAYEYDVMNLVNMSIVVFHARVWLLGRFVA